MNWTVDLHAIGGISPDFRSHSATHIPSDTPCRAVNIERAYQGCQCLGASGGEGVTLDNLSKFRPMLHLIWNHLALLTPKTFKLYMDDIKLWCNLGYKSTMAHGVLI